MPRPATAARMAAVCAIAWAPSRSTGRRAVRRAEARGARAARRGTARGPGAGWQRGGRTRVSIRGRDSAAGRVFPGGRVFGGGRGACPGAVVHQRDHRAGRRGDGLADQPGRHPAGLVSADRQHRLGDRQAQRSLVQPLVADPAGFGGPHRVGDNHEGKPVQRRVGDPVDRAGESGSPGDEDRSRCPGEVSTRRGHDGRRRLSVGEDETQPGRRGRAHHVQVRAPARDAEHHPGARPGQRGHDRHGPGRRGGWPARAAQRCWAAAHRAAPPVPE